MTNTRPIPGFASYTVSVEGVVKYARTGLVIRPKPRTGYLRVRLTDDTGKRRWANVHILVKTTFDGETPPKLLVAHHDGNRLNNHLSNLMWKSQVENERDKKRHGTHRNGCVSKTTAAEHVQAIRERVAAGQTFTALGREFGMHRSSVSRIARGIRRAGVET